MNTQDSACFGDTGIVDFLVIIPTFQRLQQLTVALGSALEQTGVSKKIIVADDCPQGSAAAVVARFPGVSYLRTPHPTGGWPGRVRNYAFRCARDEGIRARYVHFLDDDDTVPADHYKKVREAFANHPGIGVVFGVMRPFCPFDAEELLRDKRQAQLSAVRAWRQAATRYPWFYQRLKQPFRRWFFFLHATCGHEMFLCSAGILREEHFVELGGFPDARITQDYIMFTKAIRRYGALFLERETAGYGVGSVFAIWNPLDLQGAQQADHSREWHAELAIRQRDLKAELGLARHKLLRVCFIINRLVLEKLLFPVATRLGYFARLDDIILGRDDSHIG